MESSSKIAKTSDGSDASGSGSRRQGMLAVNDLTYLLEPDLSVAVGVTHKNHFFQSTTYESSQRAVCILNSGADYIDTRDSYLQFNLKLEKAGKAYFGAQGSVVNIIKTITVSTRSGDEISRVVDCNRLNQMLTGYRFDSNWVQTIGQTIGYGKSSINNANNPETTYCIPLYLLSDFFGYGRLLPSMIMSGLRIEIEFESSAVAFVHSADGTTVTTADPAKPWVTTAVDSRYGDVRIPATSAAATTQGGTAVDLGGYTVKQPQIVCKSVQLTDATQRALNEMSATNGLEIVYTDFERTETQFGSTTGAMHVEVRKACSRALQAYARIRVSDPNDLGIRYEKLAETAWEAGGGTKNTHLITAPGYKAQNFDSFASEPLSHVTSYQWQLGSLYFPQQPIKGSISEVAKAGYCHTLIGLGKFAPNRPRPSVPLGDHAHANVGVNNQKITTTEFGTHTAGLEINRDTGDVTDNCKLLYEPVMGQAEPGSFLSYGQTWVVGLERSSMFELAGVPINNSRVLALRLETGGAQIARTIDVYLKYVKLARVFLNNVEVEQ
jgi:hypothetical protein